MIVKQLTWLSKAAKEAELLISDGTNECLTFSHPCDIKEGELLKEPLHSFMVEDFMIVIDHNKNENIKRINESYFSHYCVAKVISIEESTVAVGGILIEIEGGIPGWANEGDLVEFKCSRLDIW